VPTLPTKTGELDPTLFTTQCASARACVVASSPSMDWDAYDAAVAATKDRKASAAPPRTKGAAPGSSSRLLGRVNGGARGMRPAARPPSTTRPPAKPARPADPDPDANEAGVVTLGLLREAAGAAGAGPSDAVELDLHNRGITTLARGALGRCGATLADLDLSFNAVSVVEGLEPLVALRHLRVYDNRVTDLRGLRAVGATLRSLRAQNNALASLEGIETLRALTLLRVDGNPLGTHQGTRLVGRCTALTRLDISRCGLTKLEGFATLHRLSTLAAAGNRLRSLEPLAKCVSLTELDVADNRLDDDALRHLAPLRRLDALVLDGNPIRNPAKIPTLPELVELSLARCGFATLGPRGALAAAAPSLETLDASENAVRDVRADVGAALEGIERLSEIRLARNPCAGESEERRPDESSEAATLRYRRAVVAAVPSVLYVDDIAVGDAERVVDVAPEEAIRRRDVAARLGAMGVDARGGGGAATRPRTPASFGFLGVRVDVEDDVDDDGFAFVEEDEDDDDDEWGETETEATKSGLATKAGLATKSTRALARPRSAVVAAEASRRFPGPEEDAATAAERFAARVEAYKTEMTATLARLRLGLASDPREAAARLKADGSFRAEGDAVPSRRLPAEPAVETFPPRAGPGGNESRLRTEAEAARRARDRNASGTGFPGIPGIPGTGFSGHGDEAPGARAAALAAEASARARAALDQFARAFPGTDGYGSSPASRPTTAPRRPSTAAARVAAAMAAAEAAAADSDDDRDDRDKGKRRAYPSRPVDRLDLDLERANRTNERGEEKEMEMEMEMEKEKETEMEGTSEREGGGGDNRASLETLAATERRRWSATAPPKTTTTSRRTVTASACASASSVSSSSVGVGSARPAMRRARAGSTSASLVAARRAPGAGTPGGLHRVGVGVRPRPKSGAGSGAGAGAGAGTGAGMARGDPRGGGAR
jgi:hypothetical protein